MSTKAEKLAETLCAVALKHSEGCLEQLVATEGVEKEISIFRYKEHAYCYEISWQQQGSELMFLLEIIKVTPRATKLVATRHFTI